MDRDVTERLLVMYPYWDEGNMYPSDAFRSKSRLPNDPADLYGNCRYAIERNANEPIGFDNHLYGLDDNSVWTDLDASTWHEEQPGYTAPKIHPATEYDSGLQHGGWVQSSREPAWIDDWQDNTRSITGTDSLYEKYARPRPSSTPSTIEEAWNKAISRVDLVVKRMLERGGTIGDGE